MTPDLITFLLVDDTEENLIALEALLRREGLQLLKARSGPEALELLLVHDVALALLDVQMPSMDGFELAELMRGSERTKHIPIIFVTAGARDPHRVFKGYESGAVDFLFKPIEPQILKSKADVFFELYRRRRELSNALLLNEMFVGILGHDLRNPLGAIVTGAHLLDAQLTDAGQVRTLRRMIGAADRMTRMIEQLLDLTRARLGGGLDCTSNTGRIDLVELLHRTVDELRGGQPEHDVLVEAEPDLFTTGDSDRLLQLFSNLIGNALQHGTPGARVQVQVTGAERQLLVRIHNPGHIPAEVLPTLFDPFRTRQRASRSAGLGLGLYIAQQIASSHGGSISIQSSESAGTTFSVQLPRCP
jgi:two-component system, sensor histidine kinase and response regulator